MITGIALAQDEFSPPPPPVELLISVADQKMVVLRDGGLIAKYRISTSRFGAGDSYGSYKTPLGKLRVCDKIGDDLSPGAVIKHRSATGEVIPVNAPGRDPIVTRVIWLDGLEDENHNAKARGIYIHGTPEESNLGKPVSWGCIRMRSEDVIEVYNEVGPGTMVTIIPDRLPRLHKYRPPPPAPPPEIIVSTTPPPSQAAKAPAPIARQLPQSTPAPAPEIVAKATPPPAGQQLRSTEQQLPSAGQQLLPAVAEKIADRESATARISREIAAMKVEDGEASKVSSDPGAWHAMKGSILTAGMSGDPVTSLKPATPRTDLPALAVTGLSLKEIAGGFSFTEAKLRTDAARDPDGLTQSLLQPPNSTTPSGSFAFRGTGDEAAGGLTKASQ